MPEYPFWIYYNFFFNLRFVFLKLISGLAHEEERSSLTVLCAHHPHDSASFFNLLFLLILTQNKNGKM